ncbi:MAG TPA: DNA translocase FtsK, partial [Bacillota bacterium]|nr:DNA translocase FtsK [Bacillota bacterium]
MRKLPFAVAFFLYSSYSLWYNQLIHWPTAVSRKEWLQIKLTEVIDVTETKKRRRKKQVQKPLFSEGFLRSAKWLLPLVGAFVLIYIAISLFYDKTGSVGSALADFFHYLFGNAALLPVVTLLYFCLAVLLARPNGIRSGTLVGIIILNFVVTMSLALGFWFQGFDIMSEQIYRLAGGVIGSSLLNGILRVVGAAGSILILLLLVFVAVCLISHLAPSYFLNLLGRQVKKLFQSRPKIGNLAAGKNQKNPTATEGSQLGLDKQLEKPRLSAVSNQAQTGSSAEVLPEKRMSSIRIAAEKILHPFSSMKNTAAASLPNSKNQAGEEAARSLSVWPPSEVTELTPDAVLVYQQNSEQTYLSDDESVVKTKKAHFTVESIAMDAAESVVGSSVSATAEKAASAKLANPVQRKENPLGYTGRTFAKSDVEVSVMPLNKVAVYVKPPLELLSPGQAVPKSRMAELEEKTDQLEQTLATFGVKAKVVHVSCGPAITRYELQLAPGIRVNKVANLADDIALSLAATGVRIEAPIPGKPAIGIEVPNKEVAIVAIRDVLSSPEFQNADKGVIVALGKDIAGRTIVTDLTKMPHLLIAGATGSGKSVCMNCIITSLLYRFSPQQVKLIMIDPKIVEMINYNGIPHLLSPVVTDPKKAAGVLRSVTKEMDRRYELFAVLGVKSIGQFNERVNLSGEREALPYWIVFIDELADLMIVAKEDVEESIIRIAQLARACGIHLVMGTQRPSADVITGTIKANFPSRIAFAVSSGTDSRIILDMNGAEKLLGRGDMLFQPMGIPKPIRIQGAFISEKELDAVIAHVKMQGAPIFNETILTPEELETEDTDTGELDDFFLQAAHIVIESGQGSVSYLQRRLKVGHSRAGRLMDQLEEYGVVGPAQGSK